MMETCHRRVGALAPRVPCHSCSFCCPLDLQQRNLSAWNVGVGRLSEHARQDTPPTQVSHGVRARRALRPSRFLTHKGVVSLKRLLRSAAPCHSHVRTWPSCHLPNRWWSCTLTRRAFEGAASRWTGRMSEPWRTPLTAPRRPSTDVVVRQLVLKPWGTPRWPDSHRGAPHQLTQLVQALCT